MRKRERVSRREFLERSALAASAAALVSSRPAHAAATIPHRTLGRTGASVSILALGCGSRFLMYPAEQASGVLEKALALGINYFDTAIDYGNGESETRVGRVMATRRKDVALRWILQSAWIRSQQERVLKCYSNDSKEEIKRARRARAWLNSSSFCPSSCCSSSPL